MPSPNRFDLHNEEPLIEFRTCSKKYKTIPDLLLGSVKTDTLLIVSLTGFLSITLYFLVESILRTNFSVMSNARGVPLAFEDSLIPS